MEICAGNPFCTTAPFFNGTIFLHPGENRDFSPLPLLPPQRFQPKPKSKHWRKEARLQERRVGEGEARMPPPSQSLPQQFLPTSLIFFSSPQRFLFARLLCLALPPSLETCSCAAGGEEKMREKEEVGNILSARFSRPNHTGAGRGANRIRPWKFAHSVCVNGVDLIVMNKNNSSCPGT